VIQAPRFPGFTACVVAAASFVARGSLLLWTLIATGAHWPAKLTAIVLTPGVAFTVWQESRPRTGWPTGVRPRAYELPYSRPLHEQVQAAVARAGRGERVGVRRVRRTKSGDGRDGVRSTTQSPYETYRLPPPNPGPKNAR
jgi:hypothetical protein